MSSKWGALKAKLNSKGGEKNATKNIWKPKLGKNRIRVVDFPKNEDGEYIFDWVGEFAPFFELILHKNQTVFPYKQFNGKRVVNNLTFGNNDFIDGERNECFNSSDKQLKEFSKKLMSDTRWVIPMIDRKADENKVEFLLLNQEQFNQFLSAIEDEDNSDDENTEYYDIANLKKGWDINFSTEEKEFPTSNGGKGKFNDIVGFKMAKESSPLGSKEEIEEIYENFPDLFEDFVVMKNSEMKKAYEKYVSGIDEDDDDEDEDYSYNKKSSKKKPTKYEEDDDDDAPKKSSKKNPLKDEEEEEEEEDDAPKKSFKKKVVVEKDEDDDEELSPKKSSKKKPLKDEEEEEEEEDDAPKAKKKTQADFKNLVKTSKRKIEE